MLLLGSPIQKMKAQRAIDEGIEDSITGCKKGLSKYAYKSQLQLSYTQEQIDQQQSPKFGQRDRSNHDHFKDNSINNGVNAYIGHANLKTLLSDRQMNAQNDW